MFKAAQTPLCFLTKMYFWPYSQIRVKSNSLKCLSSQICVKSNNQNFFSSQIWVKSNILKKISSQIRVKSNNAKKNVKSNTCQVKYI